MGLFSGVHWTSRFSKLFTMASLIASGSVAKCSVATLSRTVTRALSTTSAVFSVLKLMETIDHATGPEKLELLAKQQGNDDPFFMRVVERSGFKGTKDDPIIVDALDKYRMVGCCCKKGDTTVSWMWLIKGKEAVRMWLLVEAQGEPVSWAVRPVLGLRSLSSR